MSTTRYFTFEKEDKGIEREREGRREREERETSQHNIEPRQRAQLRVEIVPKRNEIDLHFQRSLIVPVPTGISFVNFEVITRSLHLLV